MNLWAADRHEPLLPAAWDEARARECIAQIVRDAESAFSPARLWPTHPMDVKDPAPQHCLYFGATGVIWALRYLASQGAAQLANDYTEILPALVAPNRAQMEADPAQPFGAYLMGDTPIRLMEFEAAPSATTAAELARLIEGTQHHPSREMMWGSPGTLMAALFLYRRTGDDTWARLFRETAAILWSELEPSPDGTCRLWSQDLYGSHTFYIDAVHGFVGTAPPLIQGRDLLGAGEWEGWREVIANTVRRSARWEGPLASWHAFADAPPGDLKLMQYCHGAPGFVICLGDFPGSELDDVLAAGAEATWAAGPLRKGPNLCHGTGGNGYAFLKMFRRTGDALWLERARAFAMHGIAQVDAARTEYGQGRYSLWTGDVGFAIYLWDCIRAQDRFPTVDVFFG
ncbi:lanthionine synthetase C family protein [Caenimonas aquaedulcis]|uniref:LanC-like protein n=1 Tax=Caenimonas aquaedulcis TaxID=2793270 RepID=A0A931H155_9BURK|nr:LanC-like protein [Caenimonas aquaedulcis]MBG9386646.1 LanC-like protein [Caenimonas aquaedulcis]